MRARDVMSTEVTTVTESSPLVDAVKLLINAGASAVPVVDDNGHIVGVLSEYDVIQRILEGDGGVDLQAHLEGHGALPEAYERALAGPVSTLMTKPAISATADALLKDVADLMVKHRVHNVPIVRGTRVEGIVNRVALVKVLLSRPVNGGAAATPPTTVEIDDEQLRRDVVAAIRRLGLPLAGGFDVVSRRGSVHLWGYAFNEEDHRNYCAAAARVPGVTAVHSHMQVRAPRAGEPLR